MNISTNNMKLNLNKSKIIEKDEKWVEQDIIVPDNMPDAIKIINISSMPYINDIEMRIIATKKSILFVLNTNDIILISEKKKTYIK